MAKGYVVKETFSRRDPNTGAMRQFTRGSIISDPAIVAELEKSDHEQHVVATTVPDQPVQAEQPADSVAQEE